MNAGVLLISNEKLYRVIASGEDYLSVLEYNGHSDNFDYIMWSKVKGEWYTWNRGVGSKIEFSKVGQISPLKQINRVHDFGSIRDSFESIIIKGQAYKRVENDGSRPIPERLKNGKIFYLTGKTNNAILSIEMLERKTLMDKAANAFLYVDNATTKINEKDVWMIET